MSEVKTAKESAGVIKVKETEISVKEPKEEHFEAYFQRASRNIYQANKQLLIDLAEDADAVRELIKKNPALPMNASNALADLMGVQEAFFVRASGSGKTS